MNTVNYAYILFILIINTKCENLKSNFSEITVKTLHPNEPISCGKNVAELQIRGITGTLYYESLSQLYNVSKLKIFNNRISKIETGALCSSPTVKSLELNFAANPEAPTLTKDAFMRCRPQMKELLLRFDFDNPSKLELDALGDLELQTLALQCYKIDVLRGDFLELKTDSLLKLILSNCHIQAIDPDVFDEMNNLEEIEISHNRNLTHLPKHMFVMTPKVKRLSLQYNRIRELDWDEFENLNLLEYLNLSGNRLAYFDSKKILSVMPNLKKLEMLKNVWPCKLKETFANDLRTKYNGSVEVIYTARNICRNY